MGVHTTRSHMLQLLTVALLAFSQSGQAQLESELGCLEYCNFEAVLGLTPLCEDVFYTLSCYDDTFSSPVPVCYDDVDFNTLDIVQDALNTCGEPTAGNTDGIQCPNTPESVFEDPTTDLEDADIAPEQHNCPSTSKADAMRQCSMFSYSHIRPFKGYRTGLETCTVPGESWYLLKHPDLSVEVWSSPAADCNNTNLTMLTKVKVTFSASQCSEGKSYVALANSTLPSTFTDGQVPVNFNSGLQLKQNGSVVSLIAVWIQTTIIIRRYMDTLSVTIQVPGDVTQESEGLCLGCPPNAFFNVTKENEIFRTSCVNENDASLLNCFLFPDIVEPFDAIINNTYVDYCLFDIAKNEKVDTLTLFKAISRDAQMLPDFGVVPVRIFPEPVPTPPTTRATTQPTTATTTDYVETDDKLFGSSSRVASQSTLTISGLLVVCLVLALFR